MEDQYVLESGEGMDIGPLRITAPQQIYLATKQFSKTMLQKAEQLMAEMEQMKNAYKQKQQEIGELRAVIGNLQQESQRKDDTIRSLQDSNATLRNDKATLVNQVKKLSRDVVKLNAFRKNIIRSINQETLSDDLATEVTRSVERCLELRSSTVQLANLLRQNDSADEPTTSVSPQKHQQVDDITDTLGSSLGSLSSSGAVLQPSSLTSPQRQPVAARQQVKSPDNQTPRPREGLPAREPAMRDTERVSSAPSTPSYRRDMASSAAPVPSTASMREVVLQAQARAQQQQQQQEQQQQQPSVTSPPPRIAVSRSMQQNEENEEAIEAEGKEFFTRAKQELSYKQFNDFLIIIKRLNNEVITKQTCLRQAQQIFGQQNPELFRTFENLLNKRVEE